METAAGLAIVRSHAYTARRRSQGRRRTGRIESIHRRVRARSEVHRVRRHERLVQPHRQRAAAIVLLGEACGRKGRLRASDQRPPRSTLPPTELCRSTLPLYSWGSTPAACTVGGLHELALPVAILLRVPSVWLTLDQRRSREALRGGARRVRDGVQRERVVAVVRGGGRWWGWRGWRGWRGCLAC